MYLQDHWSAQGSPFQNPFTGTPIEASNLWWRAVGFLEEFTAKASAEDELLGHMRSVVDGMALARKTDYTSFQSEYAISNTGLTAAETPQIIVNESSTPCSRNGLLNPWAKSIALIQTIPPSFSTSPPKWRGG